MYEESNVYICSCGQSSCADVSATIANIGPAIIEILKIEKFSNRRSVNRCENESRLFSCYQYG